VRRVLTSSKMNERLLSCCGSFISLCLHIFLLTFHSKFPHCVRSENRFQNDIKEPCSWCLYTILLLSRRPLWRALRARASLTQVPTITRVRQERSERERRRRGGKHKKKVEASVERMQKAWTRRRFLCFVLTSRCDNCESLTASARLFSFRGHDNAC
jgi:hypothetical protein